MASPKEKPPYSLWQIVAYALKLGATGFGGPVALVGYMHRDLVEQRKWIAEADYKVGLALSQIAPGPLAAQLAMYLGYVHHGILGATLVGIAFALPSFLMVVAIGWAYVTYQGLSWIQALFYGVGAAIIGIIAHSAYNLSRRTIGKDWRLWAIFVVIAAVTIITESENVWLIMGLPVFYLLLKSPPNLKRLLKGRKTGVAAIGLLGLPVMQAAVPAASGSALVQIGWVFTKAGLFVFGSGLAIVPFLYGGLVKDASWLTEQQFLDAVAVALITPGPVVITSGFMGFLMGGLPGSIVATIAIFFPAYVLVILCAPLFKKYGQRPGIDAYVTGITAATIGAIAGAVVVLGRRSVNDIPTALIAMAALVLLLRFRRKVPEPAIVLVAGVIGIVVYPLTHPV